MMQIEILEMIRLRWTQILAQHTHTHMLGAEVLRKESAEYRMVKKNMSVHCVCAERKEGQLLLEHMGLGSRAALLHRTYLVQGKEGAGCGGDVE